VPLVVTPYKCFAVDVCVLYFAYPLQVDTTTLFFPLGLADVYGAGKAWAFGGTWLT
jgi:hypothetical protein